MSKAHYTLEIGGQKNPLYGTHSGGETIKKNTEVALGTRPNTMVKVPNGGEEYRDLELELEDRKADGIRLESIIPTILESHSQPLSDDGAPSVDLDVQLVMWADDEFQKEVSRIKLKRAWVSDYTFPEGDRKSGDMRTMSVTISHRGSEFVAAEV